jgi:hypothetical protein
MAQDPKQIIADAAEAILSGKVPDNLANAAAWATKMAADNDDTAVLSVVLFAGAGYNKAAIRQLLDMSFEDSGEQDDTSDDEPLSDLIGGEDEDDKPQPATKPAKPVRQPAGATTTAAKTRRR